MIPPSKAFIGDLQLWLKTQFDGPFIPAVNLKHGNQKDGHSCGLCTANTIAVAVFGDDIWTPERSTIERAEWFSKLVTRHLTPLSSTSTIQKSPKAPSTTILDSSLLLIPEVLPGQDRVVTVTVSVQPTAPMDIDPPLGVNTGPCHTEMVNSSDDITSNSGALTQGNTGTTVASKLFHLSTSPTISQKCAKTKKRSQTVSNPSDQNGRMGSKKLKTKPHCDRNLEQQGGPVGISRSARASREARAAAISGEFKVNAVKMEKWRMKILLLDRHAEFNQKDIRVVRHSVCGRDVTVKEPYDTNRFSQHVNDECANLKPKPNAGTPTLFKMFANQVANSAAKGGIRVNGPDKGTLLANVDRKPCPGITKTNNQRILVYLGRTGALGGGGRSVTAIAMEKFGKAFIMLELKQKKEVLDTQAHEHQWRNDHKHLRVFSISCSHNVNVDSSSLDHIPPCGPCFSLLSNNSFKRALNIPIPLDENYIHVNYRFRNQHLGHLYARMKGLKELIEVEVPTS